VLDETSLIEAEPSCGAGLAGGLLVPSDGVIYQPAATIALLALARSMGARGARANGSGGDRSHAACAAAPIPSAPTSS
jgi:glycine/D-amino acid oxidase-like deaminating enzyme